MSNDEKVGVLFPPLDGDRTLLMNKEAEASVRNENLKNNIFLLRKISGFKLYTIKSQVNQSTDYGMPE